MRHLTLALLWSPLTLLGCIDLNPPHNGNGGGDSDTDTDADSDTDTDTDQDVATLRILNLSPQGPSVDAYVAGDTTPQATDLAYADVGTITPDPATGVDVRFAPTGSPPSAAIATAHGLDLVLGTTTVAAMYGPPYALQGLSYLDDPSDVADGNLRMRFSHVANGVGAVDIWTVNPDHKLISNLSYGATQVQDLERPVAGSMVALDVDHDGTTDLRFTLPNLASADQVDVFVDVDQDGPHLLFLQGDDATTRVQPEPDDGTPGE